MLIKLVGAKWINSTTPAFGGSYLSNLSMIQPGDTLADENGDPVTFGIVSVPYDAEPSDASLNPGDTKLWFDIYTNTVWSKTKKLDSSIVRVNTGLAGDDIMLKSVYDSNDDGRVNAADQIADGTNTVTAADGRTHIDNADIHRVMNDGITSATTLWSSDKIDTELDTKSNADHIHTDFNGVDSGGTPSRGFVPLPAGQDPYHVLHTDGTWGPALVTTEDITDVDALYASDGDLLIRYDGEWVNVTPTSDTLIDLTFDPVLKTFEIALTGSEESGGKAFDGPILSLDQILDRSHSILTSLDADDHVQYYNDTRLTSWWDLKTLEDLSNVDGGASNGNMLMYVSGSWKPMELTYTGNITITADELYGTINFDVPAADALINSLIY